MKRRYIAVKLRTWVLPVLVLILSTAFAVPVLRAEKADANAVKTVYFTFDDGPSAVTEEILEILKAEGIKATFFVTGPSGEKTDERLYRIASEGHAIGLHSMSHDYEKIYASAGDYIWDLECERSWIYSVTGMEVNLFRFPGGSDNPAVGEWLLKEIKEKTAEKGFIWYDWNADARDSLGALLSPEEIAANVLGSDAVAAGGDVIVLMHDSSTRKTAPKALEILIGAFREMGYEFGKLG